MDPAKLKAEYGDRLSFWCGGIDSQHILPKGKPEQVRDSIRRNIEAFEPGGGYVFNNVYNIQAEVPPENVLAMYDAALEIGRD
jgi:uroporphyrinogen decarboxylase